MPRLLHLLAAATLALASCASNAITPSSLAAVGEPGEQALARFERAVRIADAFLVSDARATLPPGRMAFDGDRLVYTHADGEIELKIRRTSFGNLVVRFGFEAQERSDGFVVGERGDGDPRVANSLFQSSFGGWKDPRWVAELLLHELTHVYYGEGTVSPWNTFTYYLEAIFLFRYDNHSAERHAHETTSEFIAWAQSNPMPD